MKIKGTRVAGCLSVGIATDMRPGRGADLRDPFSVNDRFQSDDDLAIDPPLEVQAAQPAQLAGRAKIGSKRRVVLKVYGLADGSSEIGDSRRKKMRGMEQIDVNVHSEAASATPV